MSIEHPGFILFEGLDMAGKSSIAQELTKKINKKIAVDAIYSANKGFLLKENIPSNELKNIDPMIKSNIVLNAYSKEKFPSTMQDFKEIIQDRHLPTILFYSQTRAKQDISNDPRVKSCLNPKYIFLIESSYESKRERSLERNSFVILENKILSSERNHNIYQENYRKIIEKLGIPYAVIDTTNSSSQKNSQKCLDKLIQKNILAHFVDIGKIMVDFESKVYPSTVKIKKERMISGENFPPLEVERKYDLNGNFVDILIDGRHRAYAAFEIGYSQFQAYIKYKKTDKINFSNLVKIKYFKFK